MKDAERNSVGNSNVDPTIYPKEPTTVSTVNLTEEPKTVEEKDEGQASASKKSKLFGWAMGIGRFLLLCLLLYCFICSLTFLTDAFRLITGKSASSIFTGDTLTNPIVGLMIGVLFTVLVQSSSTCTSVIVALVSSNVVDVRTAIPMVMGANIGTSMTSTLVSLTQMAEPEAYERAFAAATVHDCFNWLAVIALLFLELVTRPLGNSYLEFLSGAITNATFNQNGTEGGKFKGLKEITEPLTSKFVKINKKVLECWGANAANTTICDEKVGTRLLEVYCDHHEDKANNTHHEPEFCPFLFNNPSMSDAAIGGILLVLALIMLTGCLLLIVKLLRSMLEGSMANVMKKHINADIPVIPWITGYIAIIVGAIMTFIVQSSSVFSSTLTPMVGVGLITVERVYPLLLGSNIGTTTTAFLAALTEGKKEALQIALCHLFFNLTGIILYYPIPFMRWPIAICKILGKTTARYRWFALFYLFLMFFFLPGIIMALSLAGTVALMVILVPLIVLLFVVIIINVMQNKKPNWLPKFLKNWNFLPLWMHSLDPVDKFLRKAGSILCGCCAERFSFLAVKPDQKIKENGLESIVISRTTSQESATQEGNTNPAFQRDS